MNIELTRRPAPAPRGETLCVLRAAYEGQIAAIAAEFEYERRFNAAEAGAIAREHTGDPDISTSVRIEAVVRRRMVPDDEAAHLILLCSSAADDLLPPREAAVQAARRHVLRLVQLRAQAPLFVGASIAARNGDARRAPKVNHRVAA